MVQIDRFVILILFAAGALAIPLPTKEKQPSQVKPAPDPHPKYLDGSSGPSHTVPDPTLEHWPKYDPSDDIPNPNLLHPFLDPSIKKPEKPTGAAGTVSDWGNHIPPGRILVGGDHQDGSGESSKQPKHQPEPGPSSSKQPQGNSATSHPRGPPKQRESVHDVSHPLARLGLQMTKAAALRQQLESRVVSPKRSSMQKAKDAVVAVAKFKKGKGKEQQDGKT